MTYIRVIVLTLVISTIAGMFLMIRHQRTMLDEQLETITQQKSDLVQQEAKTAEKEQEIAGLKEQRQQDQLQILDLGNKMRANQQAFSDLSDKYEEMKGRKEALKAHPHMVEGLANKATASVFADLECSTGGTCK